MLASRIGWVSRLRLRRLARDGLVTVNGRRADWGRRVEAGDRIEVLAGLEIPTGMLPEPLPLCIVYEDDDMLAVDKAGGHVGSPDLGRQERNAWPTRFRTI